MSSLLNRLSAALDIMFGPPPIRDIWKTDREVYLRDEKEITCDWFGWTYWKVYALYQTSLTTGKTRIIEDWRLH